LRHVRPTVSQVERTPITVEGRGRVAVQLSDSPLKKRHARPVRSPAGDLGQQRLGFT
jgi:hypothetical protein